MRFEIFQINTDFIINQLEKYFYTRHFTLLLHSNKKFALSIAEVFRKIDFLPHFHLFLQSMRCALFYINTDFLQINKYINIFTQETLQPSFIWKILSNYISPFLKFFSLLQINTSFLISQQKT